MLAPCNRVIASIISFQPRAHDPDTADVTVRLDHFDGSIDLISGYSERDSGICWSRVQFRGRGRWHSLEDGDELGPAGGPPIVDIAAAADRAAADFWRYHPSTCPLLRLEEAIRGATAVATDPILRPLTADADAALAAAGITSTTAEGAVVIRSIRHADPSHGVYHIHLVRDGGAWHVGEVENSTVDNPDLDYVGDTIFLAAAPDGQIQIRG